MVLVVKRLLIPLLLSMPAIADEARNIEIKCAVKSTIAQTTQQIRVETGDNWDTFSRNVYSTNIKKDKALADALDVAYLVYKYTPISATPLEVKFAVFEICWSQFANKEKVQEYAL